MSEIIDPKSNPNLAAQQVVIELIRSNKAGEMTPASAHKNVEMLLSLHTKLSNYYKDMK